ncbi:GIY-YIG nuclease family protein [Patescibacteria group bacterium]|nr:GIY-YIG nuclease family protein [Patescibacteria group bacterium]
MYFIYILQSQIDQSYYIGYSQDPKKRLLAHNNGLTKYTKRKKPWVLKYIESYSSKRDALKREKQLKNWKSSKAIAKLINRNNLGPVV